MDRLALVIFDCDGVLIDSEPIASRTLAAALTAAGVPIEPIEAHRLFTGHAEPKIKALCAEMGLKDPQAVFGGWHAAIYAEFKRSLQPMPGIEAVVRRLERPKCVASNSRVERLEASLGLLPLWQKFAPAIYSAEMVPNPKPAPDLPLHCANAFKVDPAACVMIDDSPHGMTAARAAGMVAIGFVDPNDPRPGRTEVLKAAGAQVIAVGAEQLWDCLLAADGLVGAERD